MSAFAATPGRAKTGSDDPGLQLPSKGVEDTERCWATSNPEAGRHYPSQLESELDRNRRARRNPLSFYGRLPRKANGRSRDLATHTTANNTLAKPQTDLSFCPVDSTSCGSAPAPGSILPVPYRPPSRLPKDTAYAGERNNSTGSAVGAMPSPITSGSKLIDSQAAPFWGIAARIVKIPALIC